MPEDISRRAFICGATLAAATTALGFIDQATAIRNEEDAIAIIRVKGDRMKPAFDDGERAWFWPNKGPRVGDDAVFEFSDRDGPVFYLYRVVGWDDETVTVQQFNPRMEHVFRRSDIRSAGRVLRSKDLMA